MDVKICGQCKHFVGGGDYGLCCDKCSDLKYESSNANDCPNFELSDKGKAFILIKNIVDYLQNIDKLVSKNNLVDILIVLKKQLECVCEICGGRFCISEKCPINLYLKDCKKCIENLK